MRKALVIGVACVLLFAAATFAFADMQTYSNVAGSKTASGSVTATVTVNPKITLEITTPDASQTVDFGALDPGATLTKNVDIRVSSNKTFTLDAVEVGGGTIFDPVNLGWKRTMTTQQTGVKGDFAANVFQDQLTVAPAFTADAGTYSGTIQYTVTQN